MLGVAMVTHLPSVTLRGGVVRKAGRVVEGRGKEWRRGRGKGYFSDKSSSRLDEGCVRDIILLGKAGSNVIFSN